MKTKTFRISILSLVLFLTFSVTAQPRHHQVHPQGGAIIFTSKVNGQLTFDSVLVRMMTPYHQVIISGITPGNHSCSIQTDSVNVKGNILVLAGQTCYCSLRKEGIICDSIRKSKMKMGTSEHIQSYYIPKKQGMYGVAKVGLAISRGTSVTGQLVAGYRFSPVFALGGGIGYIDNFATLNKSANILIAGQDIRTDVFELHYLPVFLEIRITAKKQVAPYLSADIGCSFPLNQDIQGKFTRKDYNWWYSYDTTGIFHINKINPGLYVAINPGLKYWINNKFNLDFSMGVDLCVNNFEGQLPDSESRTKLTGNFHIMIGFGF